MSDSTSQSRSPSSTNEPVRRRTRWRIVVVTLLIIFGGIYLIVTPIPLIVAYTRPLEFGGGITLSRIVGVSLISIAGILWIVSGVMCWRGRWLFALIGVAVGFLAAFGANQLLADLKL
jgi:hypothetical protein